MPDRGDPSRAWVTGTFGWLAALAFLAPLAVGCAPPPESPEPVGQLAAPPVVRLLAGADPEGVLLYESWVVAGELQVTEPEAVPEDLVVVPWDHHDRLIFEIGVGEWPYWADVLVYPGLGADRLPDTEPARTACLPDEGAECLVETSDDGSQVSVTVRPGSRGEIIILNVGWLLPEPDDATDPSLPPYVSASWVFAAAPAR